MDKTVLEKELTEARARLVKSQAMLNEADTLLAYVTKVNLPKTIISVRAKRNRYGLVNAALKEQIAELEKASGALPLKSASDPRTQS